MDNSVADAVAWLECAVSKPVLLIVEDETLVRAVAVEIAYDAGFSASHRAAAATRMLFPRACRLMATVAEAN